MGIITCASRKTFDLDHLQFCDRLHFLFSFFLTMTTVRSVQKAALTVREKKKDVHSMEPLLHTAPALSKSRCYKVYRNQNIIFLFPLHSSKHLVNKL